MYIEKQKCDDCKNNSICKWVLAKGEIDKKVNEINKDKEFNSPIGIKVTCKNYEKQTKRKDKYNFTDIYSY